MIESIRTKQNRNIEFLNRIAFISFCILLVDCTISGGGRWLMIGPLSLRMIAGLISAVCALPGFISRYKEWTKNPILISVVVFIVYLGVCAYKGVFNGNRADVLWRDIAGFAWLFLIPVAMTIITNERRYETILKSILWGSLIQAFLIISINIVCLIENDLNQTINVLLIGNQIGNIDYIAHNLFRIFTKSSPYLIVGIIIMIYMQIRSEKFIWLYTVASGISLCALLLTYTRSIYGAAFISILGAIILYFISAKKFRRKIMLHIMVSVFSAFIFTIVQQVIAGENFFQFAVSRVFSHNYVNAQMAKDDNVKDVSTIARRAAHSITLVTHTMAIDDVNQVHVERIAMSGYEPDKQQYIEDTKNSDDLRNITLEELRAMISISPVFGNGLGASINYREDGLVEYFYYDILNKTGIVGLMLYCFPLLYMVFMLIRWRKSVPGALVPVIMPLCGLLAFFAASYFNPYMNAALGIACYAVALGCFSHTRLSIAGRRQLEIVESEGTGINAAS